MPLGNVGSAFVSELSRLCRAYAERPCLECIAMRAAAIMPVLLLQKPHRKHSLSGTLPEVMEER